DAVLGNPKYDEPLGDEFFDLWGALDGEMQKPRPEDLRPGAAVFRVLPRGKSIENVPGVEPCEDIRELLKAQDLLVLLHCACKRAHQDRWCGTPDESCITVGRTAQYNLNRGTGRKISYNEALEVLKKYDQYPTVNLTVNQKDVNQLICNCHYCCCAAMKRAEKSRFVAEVDPEKCRGCKICVERCQYSAVSMKPYPGIERERSYIDPRLCRGCGSCVVTCPAEARMMKVVRPTEHIPDSLSIY
ncbi:4Fe-4S binding protein, partial [Chloroflexota bacterium]